MCYKCQGTGLLPFIKPDGTISKHAKVFCECHDEYANAYPYALKPSDIDYSISYSYYRSLCQQHGWQDPGTDYPPETGLEPKPQEVIHRHINYNSDVSKKQWFRIDAISGELKYLREKLLERKKPRVHKLK